MRRSTVWKQHLKRLLALIESTFNSNSLTRTQQTIGRNQLTTRNKQLHYQKNTAMTRCVSNRIFCYRKATSGLAITTTRLRSEKKPSHLPLISEARPAHFNIWDGCMNHGQNTNRHLNHYCRL